METDTVRLRLSFEDRHMLNKSQKLAGMKQSWLLLKPQHQTISQLSSYLFHIFDLHDACPHGLILSMDGFVLPPFESTCIFKDKDIICVRKKRSRALEIVEGGDADRLVGLEFVGNQNVKLLANEEFEKETGGYESENEEDEDEQAEIEFHVKDKAEGCSVSKKRKASKKLQGSKKKKSKKSEDVKNDASEGKENNYNQDGTTPRKIVVKKASDKQRIKKYSSAAPKIDGNNDNNAKSQPEKNGVGSVDVSCTPDGTKKVPSRSARRKKAKRRWLREKLKAEREELEQKQQSRSDNHQSAEKDNPKLSQAQQLDQDIDSTEKNNTECTQEHQLEKNIDSSEKYNAECPKENQLEENSDSEDNIVPVVVRPGLIRFESLGKVDTKHAEQQNSDPLESLRLNGITSKKKGQKWGLHKNAASKKNNHKIAYDEYSETTIMEEDTTVSDEIDFEKLKPYAGLPKEGDIIAYRLIELSSLWTPELSPFRVGKISRYNNESNKVLLVTVPEYPIVSDSKMDEEPFEPASLYSEDGSLEVDFSSLIDTRIVKHGNASSSKFPPPEVDQNDSISQSQNSNEKMLTPTKAVNPWEEISEALSAKKALLSEDNSCKNKNISGKSSWGEKISPPKEERPANPWEEPRSGNPAAGGDNWKVKESSGRRSWSYKALRGSALGPIMSRLRAENGI